MKTLVIDNYDSFTFNLCQLIGEVNGEEPLVVRNDHFDYNELAALSFDNVVISPGPGRPDNRRDFGVCSEVLAKLQVPILGVCLGHQGLAWVNGGRVVHAPEPMHGRLSAIHHNGLALFKEIPQGFAAVRYHSLIVIEPLPPCLVKTAWTEDGLVMGLQHLRRPCWGVQFHPESICTEHGFQLLLNFHDLTVHWQGRLAPQAFGRCKERRTHTSFSHTERVVIQRPNYSSGFEVRTRTLDRPFDAEQVFAGLFGSEPIAFWLDSSRVEPGLSRFSAMGSGIGPLGVLVRYYVATGELTLTRASGAVERRRQSVFDYLDSELRLRRCDLGLEFDFNCGFVGYFGYELKWECGSGPRPEPRHGVAVAPTPSIPQSVLPDAMFLLADRLIVFDHLKRTTHLVCLVRRGNYGADADAWFDETEGNLACLPPMTRAKTPRIGPAGDFRLSHDRETYLNQILRCQGYIADGESYEICLTNKLRGCARVEPLELYRVLRRINPAPYAALLVFPEGAVLSSSPERFLRVDRERWVESKPIKGTCRRGTALEEDEALREHLRTSRKDRAENLMIVDLVRNDLGRVCQMGTVFVPRLMEVETYATVHQLVSTIRGYLAPSITTIDCIRSAFPGGSMTGAPKRRTMEILEAIEGEPRGVYSGAIGYLGLNGTADLNIVIRTIVLTGQTLIIGIGGAIVALSDPEDEFQETMLKGRVLVKAAEHFCRWNVDSYRTCSLGI